MKNAILLIISVLTLFCSRNIFAQRGYGGRPESFTNKELTSDVDELILHTPDLTAIEAQNAILDAKGEMYMYSVLVPANVSTQNAGTWDLLPNGDSLWRLKITCHNAQALSVLYDEFYLPNNTRLFLYNKNHRQVLGAFDSRTNPAKGLKFINQPVQGDAVYLELLIKKNATEKPILNISGVMYAYRGMDQFVGYYKNTKENTGFGNSGSCNVNINCPEGANWQSQKKGVASIACMFESQYGQVVQGFCSGTLVNNTANDGTPYFLTADHCGGTSGSNYFDQWQFYFNFESASCSNPTTEPAFDVITGCTRKARPSGAEMSGTDFLLLQLNTTEAELTNIHAYYNGWFKGSTPSPNGVCIHHPSGDIKKISTYTAAAQQATYAAANTTNGHWQVFWVQTATNWGITEGGSSGSPLFNNNKLVIGTLSGGASDCNVPASQAYDLYGRFDLHWENGGTADANRLKPWLDPNNTNAEQCEGRDAGSSTGGNEAPVADFTGNPTTVNVGGTVAFTDHSTNNPTTWSWEFDGGTPNTSNEQNPTITYNTAGLYTVKLTASNDNGSNERSIPEYIEVLDPNVLHAAFTGNPTTVNVGGSVAFTDQSTGNPTSWTWTFDGGTPNTSNEQNPTITYNTAGIYGVSLTVGDGTSDDTKTREGYITVSDNTPTGNVTAMFTASENEIIAGQCITFTDASSGGPTSWNWSFPGATPQSSTNQNPTNVCYNTPGVYDVILEAGNNNGNNTYICSNCITVVPDPTLPVADFAANMTVIPVNGTVRFTNLSQNGPFDQWAWTFEGGTPPQTNDSAPRPVVYRQVGTFDVTLRCRKTNGVQDIELKEDYIKVVPEASERPKANFTASSTFLAPGEAVNFIDLSEGDPYIWNWVFDGGTPATSRQVNPTGIVYASEGVYTVKLTVQNMLGEDVCVKEQYITVSTTDPCTEPPKAKFKAHPRLIAAGASVLFENLSTGGPTASTWTFEGGEPSASDEGSPSLPIFYNDPGIYDVTLTVTNECGSNSFTKKDYIYVWSGPVSLVCDSLFNVQNGDHTQTWNHPTGWGFIGGHNSDRIKAYADYYADYTHNQVTKLIVPVAQANGRTNKAKVRFCIWDADDNGNIDSVLGSKNVLIEELTAGQANEIEFEAPIYIEGPFYAGFEISYKDEDNDGLSDDLFVVNVVQRNNPDDNTLLMRKGEVWMSTNELYGQSASLPLSPIVCLYNSIETVATNGNINIFPNPTDGNITIDFNECDNEILSVEIYDALGRTIISDFCVNSMNEYVINIGNHPNGLYFIKINTENGIVNKKILLSK